MYKVFFNDRALILTDNKDLFNNSGYAITHYYADDKAMDMVVSSFENSEVENEVLICSDLEKAWGEFCDVFKFIDAAGGVVKNTNNEYLAIYRLEKWDLPKGKVDKGESIDVAAVREVEEECGIGGLCIIKKLPSTFHTYHQKGKFILKETHWFEMSTTDSSELVPQLEENITEAKWIPLNEMSMIMSNTYASIRELLSNIMPMANSKG